MKNLKNVLPRTRNGRRVGTLSTSVVITQSELEALKADHAKVQILAEMIKKDHPYLETDMNRTYSYM